MFLANAISLIRRIGHEAKLSNSPLGMHVKDARSGAAACSAKEPLRCEVAEFGVLTARLIHAAMNNAYHLARERGCTVDRAIEIRDDMGRRCVESARRQREASNA